MAKAYEDITNECLDRYGHNERIDVRSYEEQGIDQIPTIHLGHSANRLEQRGEKTERVTINREIQEANREIENLNREIKILEREMENIKSVDDRIAHYRQVREEVQTASVLLGHRLTDTGERSLVQQLRNLQEALHRLQPEGDRPSAPDRLLSPGEPPPVTDEPSHHSPPGSQEVSGKPAGQTRFPPSGEHRQPDVDEPFRFHSLTLRTFFPITAVRLRRRRDGN